MFCDFVSVCRVHEFKGAMSVITVSASPGQAVDKLETTEATPRREVANALSKEACACEILEALF